MNKKGTGMTKKKSPDRIEHPSDPTHKQYGKVIHWGLACLETMRRFDFTKLHHIIEKY